MKKKPTPILRAGNPADAPKPRVRVEPEGSAYVIRIESAPPVAAPDELLAVDGLDIEQAAIRKLVRNGTLRAARIGRRLYVRRSDLLALIDRLAIEPRREPTGSVAADYASLVAKGAL